MMGDEGINFMQTLLQSPTKVKSLKEPTIGDSKCSLPSPKAVCSILSILVLFLWKLDKAGSHSKTFFQFRSRIVFVVKPLLSLKTRNAESDYGLLQSFVLELEPRFRLQMALAVGGR